MPTDLDTRPLELPVLQGAPPPERADAARNRERILCAARRLMEARGPEGVSMDCVAHEAGVGKGTLYRRFGDRASLLRALVEEEERRFQDALIRGPAPLGPGAAPAQRLHAFGDGLLDLMAEYAPFLVDLKGSGRLSRGPYAFYRTHIDVLLREAVGPTVRVDYLGDALLVVLSAEHVTLQLQGKGMALDDVRAGWHALADAVLGA